MIPGAEVFVKERDHISHKVEMHYLLLTIYSTLIAILLRDYNAAFYTIVDIYLFYDLAHDMQISTLLTRHHCRVSYTQVTVQVHVPFVLFLKRELF